MVLHALLLWAQIGQLRRSPLRLFALLLYHLCLCGLQASHLGAHLGILPLVSVHPVVGESLGSALSLGSKDNEGNGKPVNGASLRERNDELLLHSRLEPKSESLDEKEEQEAWKNTGSQRLAGNEPSLSVEGQEFAESDDAVESFFKQEQQQQKQQHLLLLQDGSFRPSSGVLLRDLPHLAFPRPSFDLVRLTKPLAAGDQAREMSAIKNVYPFGVPIEVRSIANGTKYNFILESVLGAGGQGIVLQARDARSPETELAVKVFLIHPKRQRGIAHDMERLKRRVQLEVAIAKSAPVDIPLGVWSHLSHIVMPLDVVEPTLNFTPPPEDRTRYWQQWVVFERFAGDLAMLRGLPYASASAKLSATKQMLLSVVRMHDMGMVHSDIKTQNFFVKSDGRIFLGDYSLAHPVGYEASCTEGTAAYLPPENLKCRLAKERTLEITAVKDSWALGTVFYRVWCFGSRPYNVDDLLYEEVLDKLAGVRIEDLDFSHCSPDTPVAILHMMRLLLEPNAALRPRPRDIYERHPAFTMDPNAILADTLGSLILTVNTKGLSLNEESTPVS